MTRPDHPEAPNEDTARQDSEAVEPLRASQEIEHAPSKLQCLASPVDLLLAASILPVRRLAGDEDDTAVGTNSDVNGQELLAGVRGRGASHSHEQ